MFLLCTMDFKFPNNEEYRKRTCFLCKKNIEIGEFIVRNKIINEQHLIELWQNDKLEFYCCLCYETLNERNRLEHLQNKLDLKEREILKILEKRYKIKLPLVLEIKYNTIGFIEKDGTIIGLGLFRGGLQEVPEELTELTNLEVLNLAWNRIELIPDSISSLLNLKELDLIGNKISHISKNIGKLPSLIELDLSFNCLETIPETIGDLSSLKVLKLIRNNITRLPESLKLLETKGVQILL